MAAHEGKAGRQALRGLVTLGEIISPRHVQYVSAVELEEVQGLEHPIRFEQ